MEWGLYFLHEHPEGASSWKEPSVQRLLHDYRVHECTGHMCQFGMTSIDRGGEAPVKKPTRFMTNSPCVANQLSRRCPNRMTDQKRWHQRRFRRRAHVAPAETDTGVSERDAVGEFDSPVENVCLFQKQVMTTGRVGDYYRATGVLVVERMP